MLRFLLLVSSFMVLTSYASQEKNLLKVPSPGLHLLNKATLIKPVPSKTKISFIAWLKLRNKHELDQLVQDVYDPSSPHYQQFLTLNRYEQEFAPSKEMEDAVQNYFASYGMQTKIVHHSVRVTATVEQVEQSLHVQMNYYRYQGEIVRANSSNPQLNSELSQYIAGITGLSTIPEFSPDVVHSPPNDNFKNVTAHSGIDEKSEMQELNFVWNNLVPSAIPTTTSLNGFTGAQLQTTYNLKNIPQINGVSINGSGQTLVIVDLCFQNNAATILNNSNVYFGANSIVPGFVMQPSQGANFSIINADGSPYSTCGYPANAVYDIEMAIDTQSSHTIAPGANTVLVLGNGNAQNSIRTTLIDVINTLLENNFTIGGFSNAYVISNSWSYPEGSTADTVLEQNLQLAAAAGVSVNFSSGDCGDNTYVSPVDPKCSAALQSSVPVTNYPSSSAYVTAIGGTSLFVDQNYHYAFETVWGTVGSYPAGAPLSFFDGTTGGVSKLYGPVSWQNAISGFTAGGYGVINQLGYHRATPDISMLGFFGTGLLIYEGSLPYVKEGGTSLACPLFSGTLVLVNQVRHLLNKGPIGQAAPYLYQMNNQLLSSRALNLIIPPALIISGATPPPSTPITTYSTIYAPASSFTINGVTMGWDSSLTLEPENQFWNDGIGVGSPNIPNFVPTMASM